MCGPFIVHDPEAVRHLTHYDEELVVVLADEWRDPSVCLKLEGAMAGGVQIKAVAEDADTPFESKHLPGHPDANEQDMVVMPNVDPTFEMIDLMTSARAYEANLQAVQQSVRMAEQALELGR